MKDNEPRRWRETCEILGMLSVVPLFCIAAVVLYWRFGWEIWNIGSGSPGVP